LQQIVSLEEQQKVHIPWYQAIHHGYSRLLNDENNSRAINPKNGQTLLHVCVNRHKYNFVSRLIELKADINACDNDQKTPLVIAVQNRNMKMIDLLLKHGADPRIPYRNATLLHEITSQNLPVSVLKLFEKYEFLEYFPTESSGWTVIHASRRLELLKFFRSRNFDLHIISITLHFTR
jgi:ankyrin repeat protein